MTEIFPNNDPHGFVVGQFISETKNRFRCIVKIDNLLHECHIASSSRLEHFINLEGKQVILTPVRSTSAKAKFTVYGVRHKRGFILLSTLAANQAIKSSLFSRTLSCLGKRSDVKSEFTVHGYKADFYIPGSQTIIEVKSVITEKNIAVFPSDNATRILGQLEALAELLKIGYNAHLLIVSLNPYVKQVEINANERFRDALTSCVSAGLNVSAFTCRLSSEGVPCVDRKIPITF